MELFQCTVYNTKGVAHYSLGYTEKKQTAYAVLTSVLRALKQYVKLIMLDLLQNVML